MRALAVVLPALAFAALAPRSASAADVDRRGFQFEGMLGGSICLPGKANCKSADAADTLTGKTGPSFGMGFTLGFRPLRSLMVGAAYNVGFFNPDYINGAGADVYKRAYQNSVFAVVRAILPIWRVDLGLELGAGYSRQAFKVTDDNFGGGASKQFSQGFALKLAPVVDFYVTRRVFLGVKVDFIFNFHGQVCTEFAEGSRVCGAKSDTNQASVHQMMAGLHVGATF